MVGPVVIRIVVPSGARVHHRFDRDQAVAAGAILHDHAAVEQRPQVLGHQAGDQVAAASGREWKHDLGQRTALRTRARPPQGRELAHPARKLRRSMMCPRSLTVARIERQRNPGPVLMQDSRLSPIARRRRA
jgi:hypothetical protein